jgi:hypothetical protein
VDTSRPSLRTNRTLGKGFRCARADAEALGFVRMPVVEGGARGERVSAERAAGDEAIDRVRAALTDPEHAKSRPPT